MPELPEVYHLARQMHGELMGKTIAAVEVLQEKCLNMPVADFKHCIIDKPIEQISSRGKWIVTRLRGGAYLLISLGMGGDVIYHQPGDALPPKYQFRFDFDDQRWMHLYFSWFGYVHAANEASLKVHKMTAELGICPLSEEFTLEKFRAMLTGKKGGIKAYLMNQHHIAGIGNVYIQDILFKARLHPNRKIVDLSNDDIQALYTAITGHLRYAAGLGGLIYERDFYGQNGRYTYNLVGHKPDTPCPVCGTLVQALKTGSTRSFICPTCQK